MAAIIETRHLTHIYNAGMPDATTALEDVSFAVEEGDFVGIIGSTGSGKSTLITHFNGILKPTSGQVLLDGKDIWAKGQDIRKVRFAVGLVFQYPEYQLFEETIYKDIAFGPKNMGGCAGRRPSPACRRNIWSAAPSSCPAVRSAGWPLRACWPWSPGCWCWTSPPRALTRKAGT